MPDLLTIWLGTQAVSFVFRPILEDLAKEVAKDGAKDFCRGALKAVLHGRDEWKQATGRAVAQFLVEFQQELIGAGVEPPGCAEYTEPLRRLTGVPEVRAALGTLVIEARATLEAGLLNRIWNEMGLPTLPADFRWQALTRRCQSQARAIALEFPELRALLDSQNLQRLADTVAQAAPPAPGFDLVGYASAMREKYRRLRLESLDVTGAYYRELDLWRVFIPQNLRECQEYLPQVLELPKEHLRRLREAGELEGRDLAVDEAEEVRRRYVEQPSRDVLELTDDPALPLLVILGDPGSGKSCLLQALLLRWTEAPPADLPNLDLPLLIELRLYAQARQRHDGIHSFLEFLHRDPGALCHLDQHLLRQRLETGRVRVFFDGLDEIFEPALREEIITSIHAFSNDFPRARLVVTSRPIGYKGEALRHAGFRHFMLQELDDEQIGSFLTKWYTDTYNPRTEAQERDEKRARLIRALQETRAIRELAGNPLLLTMMAILNRNHDLPRDRAELYEQCSRLLLYQWKVEEALRADPDLVADATAIGLREKQAILRRLAREMQSSPEGLAGNIIAADRLERIVGECIAPVVKRNPIAIARGLIRQLRERNFILCFVGGNSYAFVHRTFLEYFCADDLRVRFDHEKSIDLDYLKREVYGAHWPDERWHEVLCLLAGVIHPAAVAELVTHLLAEKDPDQTCQHIFLAARCVGEVRGRDALGAAEAAAQTALQALTGFDLDYYYEDWDPESSRVRGVRTRAVGLFAEVWISQPTTRAWIVARAQHDASSDVQRAAVAALARGWKDDPDTLPWLKTRAQQDDSDQVRSSAVLALARGWKDDPDTLPWLKARAQEDESWWVRLTVVQELARSWKTDPDTLPGLKNRVQQDENPWVRFAAALELARGWKDDPDTPILLKTRAQQDKNRNVRLGAMVQLAGGWREDPETLTLLKTLAEHDEDALVQRAAAEQVVRGWNHDPETLPWLKTQARNEAKETVREAAVQALATGWKTHRETLVFLKSLAQEDKNEAVREAAICGLARGWKDDAETRGWLQTRAEHDPDNNVRQTAVKELVRGWKADPGTLALLKYRAEHDQEALVRGTAVEELARGWRDDPETLTILKTRVQRDESGWLRQVAVRELARGWRQDPQTLTLLKNCAQQDWSELVQRAAARELARGWKDDPDTLTILKKCAQQDKHRDLRQAAAQELARGWRHDPEVQAFLAGLRKEKTSAGAA